MSEIQELMDRVGNHNQLSDYDYAFAVFQWMDEATREIQRLQKEVESLTRVLNSRTEHLV